MPLVTLGPRDFLVHVVKLASLVNQDHQGPVDYQDLKDPQDRMVMKA